jgi:N6-adenosine-specific RNA methylase IME4
VSGPFRTVMLDPPWPESGGGKIKRGADRHYPLIRSEDRMFEVISQDSGWNPADNAHMYMWVTNNYLPWGMRLIDRLGFRYVTNIAWVKLLKSLREDSVNEDRLSRIMGMLRYHMVSEAFRNAINVGLGQYFGGSHELLLFAVRGKGYDAKTGLAGQKFPTVVHAPLERHSQKPNVFYEMVEARSEGPYLEMFARRERPGWQHMGNEIAHKNPDYPNPALEAE